MADQRDTWGEGLGMVSGALPGLLRMYLGQQGGNAPEPPGTARLNAPGTTVVPGGFGPPINPRQGTASSISAQGFLGGQNVMPPGWLGQLLGPQGAQGLMGQQQGLLAPTR